MPFFNIFSKKPIKEKKTKRIIVDNREKNSLVVSELISQGNKIEFKQLEIADYIIGEIAIERKTISDFISSMLNKRLFIQLKNLQQYEKSLLIIENYQEMDLRNTNLNENTIRGLILSISLEYKIPIIFTKNEKDTALYLSLIAKKEKSDTSLRAKQQMTDSERLKFILEGFPGIGPKTAKKLLKNYKTLKQVINAKEEELSSFIGKKAEKFLELINKIYKNKD
ncbi:MAG: ERCC4 domain-containing protein [Nanoarchaeota archaeon]